MTTKKKKYQLSDLRKNIVYDYVKVLHEFRVKNHANYLVDDLFHDWVYDVLRLTDSKVLSDAYAEDKVIPLTDYAVFNALILPKEETDAYGHRNGCHGYRFNLVIKFDSRFTGILSTVCIKDGKFTHFHKEAYVHDSVFSYDLNFDDYVFDDIVCGLVLRHTDLDLVTTELMNIESLPNKLGMEVGNLIQQTHLTGMGRTGYYPVLIKSKARKLAKRLANILHKYNTYDTLVPIDSENTESFPSKVVIRTYPDDIKDSLFAIDGAVEYETDLPRSFYLESSKKTTYDPDGDWCVGVGPIAHRSLIDHDPWRREISVVHYEIYEDHTEYTMVSWLDDTDRLNRIVFSLTPTGWIVQCCYITDFMVFMGVMDKLIHLVFSESSVNKTGE